MSPWWGEVVAHLILVAVLGAWLLIREARLRRIRRRENAATLAEFEVQHALAEAKAEARKVIRLADRRAAR